MIKAIILDMDGTIINSDGLVLNIYQELTKKHKPLVSLNSISKEDLLAKNYNEILEILYGSSSYNLMEEVFNLHNQLYFKHLTLFEDTLYFLDYIKGLNKPIYLFTSELKELTIKTLKHLEIDNYFDDIVAFEDVSNPKPNSEGLELILNKYNYKTSEVIFIGDSVQDGLAASNINMTSVFMNWFNNKEKEEYFKFSVTSFKELIELINSFNSVLNIKSNKETFKIIQFTDLHLMVNDKVEVIEHIITTMVNKHQPDLIVYTGDQTMSDKSVMLYERLIKFTDSFNLPWTFIFGNHDTDGGISYDQILSKVSIGKNLYFNQGLKLLGYSNFYFILNNQTTLYFLDSHCDSKYLIDNVWTHGYDEIWQSQLNWMEKIKEFHPNNNSLIFLHIPPYIFKTVEEYQGNYQEEVCSPLLNNNFDKTSKVVNAKGVFVGHDHYNDFSFTKDDIVYAYGRVTGFFDYKDIKFDRGCRIIELNNNEVKTYVDIINL